MSKLSADRIRDKTFALRRDGGYDPVEVEAFLHAIADRYDTPADRPADSEDPAEDPEAHADRLVGRAVEMILNVVRETAETANDEAGQIIAAAKQEAKAILEQATDDAAARLGEAEQESEAKIAAAEKRSEAKIEESNKTAAVILSSADQKAETIVLAAERKMAAVREKAEQDYAAIIAGALKQADKLRERTSQIKERTEALFTALVEARSLASKPQKGRPHLELLQGLIDDIDLDAIDVRTDIDLDDIDLRPDIDLRADIDDNIWTDREVEAQPRPVPPPGAKAN